VKVADVHRNLYPGATVVFRTSAGPRARRRTGYLVDPQPDPTGKTVRAIAYGFTTVMTIPAENIISMSHGPRSKAPDRFKRIEDRS